eukprot:c34019_g1_i1 orf=86-256(+)
MLSENTFAVRSLFNTYPYTQTLFAIARQGQPLPGKYYIVNPPSSSHTRTFIKVKVV